LRRKIESHSALRRFAAVAGLPPAMRGLGTNYRAVEVLQAS
jgi:hypothetical protein